MINRRSVAPSSIVIRTLGVATLSILFHVAFSQGYNASRIFAHNDYVRPRPFYTAFDLGVGYIEADVFLVDGVLLVAHQRTETAAGRTLEALYLEPLLKQVERNHGSVYANSQSELTLMVDLKTEGESTIDALVQTLQRYPRLLACPGLHFMVSGNVPPPNRWKAYPSFMTFDGRPGIAYSPEELKRVALISTSFGSHAGWDGKQAMRPEERKKIEALIGDAHAKGKKMRFWATPDFQAAWQEQMNLHFDVIVTDDVTGLAAFIAGGK